MLGSSPALGESEAPRSLLDGRRTHASDLIPRLLYTTHLLIFRGRLLVLLMTAPPPVVVPSVFRSRSHSSSQDRIRHGKLPNGMKYYVMKTYKPRWGGASCWAVESAPKVQRLKTDP